MSDAGDLDSARHLIEAGRLDEASEICRRNIERSADPEAIFLLAVIAGKGGLLAESVTLFEEARRRLPERADVAYNYGVILRSMGKLDAAMEQWARAAELNPALEDARFNLGRGHAEKGRWDDAIGAYDSVLAVNADHVAALYNQGNVYFRMGRRDRARACFARVVALDAGHVQARINLGLTDQRDGRTADAIRSLEAAVALAPDNVLAHFNLGQALLQHGRLGAGLTELEWRRKVQDLRFPVSGQTAWTGGDLTGRRILLYGEQGQGDVIQFLRYARPVADRGATVTVCCHPPLVRVARSADGVGEAIAFGDQPPPFDTYAPLMSLPHLLGMDSADAIPPAPYLTPPPARPLAAGAGTLRVGLVWAGSPAHEDDINRSCPFAALRPLFDLPGIAWFSLQVGSGAGDPAAAGMADVIQDLGAEFADFADTAAAVEALDLVVSVDTAAAHLAGALGRPVWLMLQRVPDWRWPRDGAETPWYPSARLFRQRTDGDWDGVVDALRGALAELARGRRPEPASPK